MRLSSSIRNAFIALAAIIAMIFVFAWVAFGQNLEANHPELRWRTFETEHFVIHYHEGAERTANVIARIAEEIHGPITDLYDYEPDTKFHFMVRDTDDYANGAAYYYNNKMLIWCTALDYDLRGTTNWLRNVITHEYTHIIQLGAARKMPRFMPAIYIQGFGYEEEQRPDVLYGYPNVLASYPIAMTVMPMWFAEGTAQFNAPQFRYDYLDSHRDMQFRVRALNDDLLPLNEMEVFGKTSLGSEAVYNHGYSLVTYIAENYGADKLADLTRSMKTLYRFDFNSAVEEVLGIDGQELYDNWKAYLEDHYRTQTANVMAHEVTGDEFEHSGYMTLYPQWSPDGTEIFFTSNMNHDYAGQRSLYRRGLDQEEAEEIEEYIASPFDISADGRWLVYSKIVPQWNESLYADLYLYDLEEEEEYRVTHAARAMDPSFSPDERSLVFIVNHDGTKDVGTLELPERGQWPDIEAVPADSIHQLTDFRDGTQCWRPAFSPDGEWIAYARGRDLGRDVVLVRPDGSDEQILVGGDGDQRDPAWSVNGDWLYYSSDVTGIFNLYRYHLDSGRREALTNVIGGAFQPSLREDGAIAYVEYGTRGFEVKVLESPAVVPADHLEYDPGFLDRLPEVTFNDTDIDTAESHAYRSPFENLFFIPRITWDYNGFKPGVYIYSSDFLEKLSLFAGGGRNMIGETDLFFLTDFRAFRPTLFFEGFFITREDDQRFDDPLIIVGEEIDPDTGELVPIYDTYGVSYDFQLIEADLGLRMDLFAIADLELRGVYSRYQAFLKFEDLSSFSYTYFKGKYLQARFDFDYTQRRIHGNVNPLGGWRGQLTVAYEDNEFIEGFEVNAEKYTLQEVYTPYRYWRLEGDVTTWWNPVGELSLQPRLRGGYLTERVDPFMHLYAGGLHGMKGFSYYSLGGSRRAIGTLTMRHPIWTPDRPRFGWFHFDGLYGAVFGDVGTAWRGDFDADDLRSDMGFELRAKFYSWYGYPTAVTFSAARALQSHSVTERDITTQYDPEWKYYLTVLFEFETIFPQRGTAWR